MERLPEAGEERVKESRSPSVQGLSQPRVTSLRGSQGNKQLYVTLLPASDLLLGSLLSRTQQEPYPGQPPRAESDNR